MQHLKQQLDNQCEATFKIFLLPNNDVRRFTMTTALSFDGFLCALEQLFGEQLIKLERKFLVKYKDEEGDEVTVSSELEWQETLRCQCNQPLRKFFIYQTGGIPTNSQQSIVVQPKARDVPGHFPNNNNTCAPAHHPQQQYYQQPQHYQQHHYYQQQQQPLQQLQSRNVHPATNEQPASFQVNFSLFKEIAIPAGLFNTTQNVLVPGQLIHLRCKSTGKNLRILNDGTVNGLGGKGDKAKFLVHAGKLSSQTVRLQSVSDTQNWLRIKGDGKTLDGLGRGGPFTEFLVVVHPPAQAGGEREISLRSFKNEKNFGVGILKNGNAKEPFRTGLGSNGRFVVVAASAKNNNNKIKGEKKRTAKK